MASNSVFVPRGFWLVVVLLWAALVIGISYLGTVEAARGISVLECRLPNSTLASRACLAEQEAIWFRALVGNTVPWWLLFGVVLPILVQAGMRAVGRRLRS